MAMGYPADIVEFCGLDDIVGGESARCVTAQRRMDARLIVIGLELAELALKVHCVPEKHVVKKLPPGGSDQAFHERVGRRRIRNRLQFINLQNTQIRLSSMKFEQRVMVGTNVVRGALPTDGIIEHSTEIRSIDGAVLHAESGDAPGKLVHDHQHPVAFKKH